jgi:hypothetical protein
MPTIVGVFREREFSPGRVDDDAAILEATAASLTTRGFEVRLGGIEVAATPRPAAILAMCQSEAALARLEQRGAAAPVVNTPRAIRNCHRTETVRLLATAAVAFPPTRIVATDEAVEAGPCWVKRADVHAMAAEDVAFAADRTAVHAALAGLAARGVPRAALQEHVAGTVVKFYGIADGRFFRCYTTSAEPPADLAVLWRAAAAAARALGLEIFGGDLVVTPTGRPVVIDVNDWPSFARCRDEAADAIASYVQDRVAAGATESAPHLQP